MDEQPSKSEKFGISVRRSYPYFLLIGPILMAAGLGASFIGIIGAALLGMGLHFLAIDLSEKK